jgi:hypothetical protein
MVTSPRAVLVEADVPTGCAVGVAVDVVDGSEAEDAAVVDAVVVDVLSRFADWASEHPAAVKAMLTPATIRSAFRRMV